MDAPSLKLRRAGPLLIVAAVAAMVVTANIREGRRARRPMSSAPAFGAPGATPTSREGLAQRITEMEARLSARPDDLGAAVLLSDALMRQSRVTGRTGFTMRAEQVLKQALREDPGNYDVRRMQATLYLSQHRFAEALAIAERCRIERPDDPVTYGVLGDAHLELGEYDEAFEAFDRMMRLRPNAASYARASYARELQGDLAGALEAMRMAASASEGGDLEGVAWYHAHVGELLLHLNRTTDAMEEFSIASQAFPGHPFAVVGYAKAIESLGRVDEARALLEDLVQRTPTPDVYARLGDMAMKAGRSADATRSYALAEAMWRSDTPEPKNLARFLADRGERTAEAVAIAEDALRLRHDIFTQDALAWAYFKAGRIAEAKQTIVLAQRTGSKDPDILRHARIIAAAPLQVAVR
jgi:tetratricopeptide (TPR) repeat protein